MALAAYTGYYCAYFAFGKHAKPIKQVISDIYAPEQKHVDSIDVPAFLERKRKFWEAYNARQTDKSNRV